MKKILLILTLCAGLAQADVLATAKNKGDGVIALTDISIEKCGNGRVVYSTSPNNRTLWGCWFIDEIMIHITWDDGSTRSYPIQNFSIRKKGDNT